MPRNNTDPRIDTYIEALPVWQQAICRQVRDLAHAADPEHARSDQAYRSHSRRLVAGGRRPTPRGTGRGSACCSVAGAILLGVRVRAGELGSVRSAGPLVLVATG